MNHQIHIRDCMYGYLEVCEHVLHNGRLVSPRGIDTAELQAVTIVLSDPRKCIVSRINRRANLAIGAAEAVQLIGGFSDPETMVKLSSNFAQFMDDGEFYGAYGPRVNGQLEQVTRILRQDPYSRRARVQIWRPEDVYAEDKHDYPCTLGFTFQIRDGKLDMHTHMRSNDVWWGFTYDVMQFCLLQLTVADMLNVGYGTYFHHVDSLHLYKRDVPGVQQLMPTSNEPDMFHAGIHAASWSGVKRACRLALEGKAKAGGDTCRRLSQMIGAKLNEA